MSAQNEGRQLPSCSPVLKGRGLNPKTDEERVEQAFKACRKWQPLQAGLPAPEVWVSRQFHCRRNATVQMPSGTAPFEPAQGSTLRPEGAPPMRQIVPGPREWDKLSRRCVFRLANSLICKDKTASLWP
jgi:hypothetical protein